MIPSSSVDDSKHFKDTEDLKCYKSAADIFSGLKNITAKDRLLTISLLSTNSQLCLKCLC